MESSKGCEVKRETLNLVVSPVRMGLGRAEALVMAAGNRDQDAKKTSAGPPLRGRRQHRAAHGELGQARLVRKVLGAVV